MTPTTSQTSRTSQSSRAPVAAATRSAALRWAVALCWVAVALDGFDLVVIGAVIPVLSKSGELGFTRVLRKKAKAVRYRGGWKVTELGL